MNFSAGRTALYWVVLIAMLLYFVGDDMLKTKKTVSFVFLAVFFLLSFLVVVNFVNTANISYTKPWKSNADIPKMLDILKNEISIDKPCNLLADQGFHAAINYYIIAKEYMWLNPLTYKYNKNIQYDYIFTKAWRKRNMKNKNIVKVFETSKTKLLKIKRSNGCPQQRSYYSGMYFECLCLFCI